jgi:hypothetical protein
VRVRLFELRLLAAALTVLWTLGGFIVLIAYRPGGPWDVLVGASALLPLLLSVAGLVWPPLVTSGRGSAGVFWLGLLAGLLLIPCVAGLTGEVLARRTTPLLPSAEIVYPWVLALLATGLFAGLGISRELIAEAGIGRKRLTASIAFALVASLAVGTVFAGVSLANYQALRDKPAAHSRFGPTDAALAPPSCGQALVAGATAGLYLRIDGNVDGHSIGDVELQGVRAGADVSWTAWVYSRDQLVEHGAIRIGDKAWELQPGRGWQTVAAGSFDGDMIDSTVLDTALSVDNRMTSEDRGLEYVEGARARHCRVAIDGGTFRAAFPQTIWLTGEASLLTWRGRLDFWVFDDAQVGRVEATVNGLGEAILAHGVQATVNATLTATDRGRPVGIDPPKS